MRFRLIHTADWHLGHSLHQFGRDFEHAKFLDWLAETLRATEADALLIAGDLFDSNHPPAQAEKRWFEFLARLNRECPGLQVVLTGGNHDSPSRLDAPGGLLRALGVRVFGGFNSAGGREDLSKLAVPLHDRAGKLRAWCAALPFLRPADLPLRDHLIAELADAQQTSPAAPQEQAESRHEPDPLIEGVRSRYASLIEWIEGQRQPEQALIAMGHCYLAGTKLSEMSERKVLGGNQHALPAAIFPTHCDYVALGHLHRAQKVGEREEVRYSGSPLPLSFAEIHYKHQVVQVDFLDTGRLESIQALSIPRAVELMVVPGPEGASMDALEPLLSALPERSGEESDPTRPFLEVRVRLDHPEPRLRERIQDLLLTKQPRLLKITRVGQSATPSLGPAFDPRDLGPTQMFEHCYAARFPESQVSPQLRTLFQEVLEETCES